MIAARTKTIIPATEELSLKQKIFNGLVKLEDVYKHAKTIHEKYRGEGDKPEFLEVTDPTDKIFILTFLTFTIDKKVQAKQFLSKNPIKLFIGTSFQK